MAISREQVLALVGKPLEEADALLGPPEREDTVRSQTSTEQHRSLRRYYELGDLRFVLESTRYTWPLPAAASGWIRPADPRYKVSRVAWFPSREKMDHAMQTWETDYRSL